MPLVRRLNLKPLKRKKLQLNTFGELGFKGKTCELVKVHLHALGTDEVVQLQALQFLLSVPLCLIQLISMLSLNCFHST